MEYPEPLCFYCKYIEGSKYDEAKDKTTYYCKAYPGGIAEAILHSGHFYPKPDDNGIRFERNKKRQLPEWRKQTQSEEDANYRGYKEFFDEGNMADEEFTEKMKREHGEDWYLYQKPSRVNF